MRIEYVGHYRHIVESAEACNARSVSIQNYYVFVNFLTVKDAEAFIKKMPLSNLAVNTHRGEGGPLHVPAEVAVPHLR